MTSGEVQQIAVPSGKIATVATHLEMRAAPAPRPGPSDASLSVQLVAKPGLDWYRAIFRAVGADWLWFSRLGLSDGDLGAILGHDRVDVYALTRDKREIGFAELDGRQFPDIELAFFGLVVEAIGTGAGRLLMNTALEAAWASRPQRVWVHTCTFDHPDAVAFYLRSGFTVFARTVEIEDDPRLTGTLPRGAAPDVPIV